MSQTASRRPKVFRLDPAGSPHAQAGPQPVVEEAPDIYAQEARETADALRQPADDDEAVVEAQKAGVIRRTLLSWGGLFWSALSSLLLFAIGLWFTSLIEDMFRRAPALGYAGLALVGLLALALLVLLIRELRSIMRQRHIAQLHIDIGKARTADDTKTARTLMRELLSLYGSRPDTAKGRSHVEALTQEIVDGRDLIDIAERELMLPLDRRVSSAIATAAKRVSVVTAVSPRAIVDVLFVAAQSVRLIREIANIYGGRPGFFGFLKLLKSVSAHIAVTGGMAVGDSLIQQILGHGLAARLSARLGEGVLNGFLTTRIGLSAMAVCRPMAFEINPAPGVSDVAPFLFSSGKDEKKA
ncbi:MAG: TIGR01620 family protein [Hyphomicrobiales bacterium]|nr:TIGR01620 family protein [Hyphomicrobiales bacterium]